jgi:hypothetical protein
LELNPDDERLSLEVRVAERVLYQRADKKWAWRGVLTADNGDVIAPDGSQGYENEGDARSMADRIIGGEFKDAAKKIVKPLATERRLATVSLVGTWRVTASRGLSRCRSRREWCREDPGPRDVQFFPERNYALDLPELGTCPER